MLQKSSILGLAFITPAMRLFRAAVLFSALPGASFGRAAAQGYYSDGRVESYSAPAAIIAVNRSVSVSYQITDSYYIEPSDGGAFTLPNFAAYSDCELGTERGGRAALSWTDPEGRIYLYGDYARDAGNVAYTGFTLTTNMPLDAVTHYDVSEYNFKLGTGFAARQGRWMLTPYLGYGTRYWDRSLSATYDEYYTDSYLSLGGLVQEAPLDWLVISEDMSVGKLIDDHINVTLDGSSGGENLRPGPLIKLALELNFQIVPALSLFTRFGYTYFSFGQSNVYVAPGSENMEPMSHTSLLDVNTGLRIPLGFPTL